MPHSQPRVEREAPAGVLVPGTRRARSRRRRRVRQSWFVALLVIAGTAIFTYPSAASWFSALAQDGEVSGYVSEVAALQDPVKERILDEARDYNAAIPEILLTDPYAADPSTETTADGAVERYLAQLQTPGSKVMARVQIPAINVDLPIYHGTSEEALENGVGHLFGSSLPVGGASSHSVLTGHSGLVSATLFDNLKDVQLGDTFSITVLDEVLYYVVDDIRTVLPTEVEDLAIGQNKDYVTLVTCTPTGVNSHRLLVRGERVDVQQLAPAERVVAGSDGSAGFPWWALILAVSVLVAVALAAWLRRDRR